MRRLSYVIGGLVAVGVLIAWWLWPRGRKGRGPERQAAVPASQEQETGYTPRQQEDEAPTPRPEPRRTLRPDGGVVVRQVYVPGKGPMTLVEDPNAVPPPPKDQLPEAREKPEIPPELPQTPDWKLKMTRRLVGTMEKSIARLERRIREAKRSGADPGEIRRLEVLLERRRMRLGRLQSDVKLLEQQVAAQGQARPGVEARADQGESSPRENPRPRGEPEEAPPEPTYQQPPGP